MHGRPILISLMLVMFIVIAPINVVAYFVSHAVSSALTVNVGDWQPPTLSFWLNKKNQTPYPITEAVQNLDFIENIEGWQTSGDMTRRSVSDGDVQTWVSLTPTLDSNHSSELTQTLPSSNHPRWLAFTYRVTADSPLCGTHFVPVKVLFNQKLVWYLTFTPCQNDEEQWQTTIVQLPQFAGELRFQVQTDENINLSFDVTRITTLAAALTSQDEIEIKANEITDLNLPIKLNFDQDNYQVVSYQAQDLAGKLSPPYNLVLLWQSHPPQLSQDPIIYRDSSDKLSLLLTFPSPDCINLTFDQNSISAPVIPWLDWSGQNHLICPQGQTVPISLALPVGHEHFKILMSNQAGLKSESIISIPLSPN